jgi:uncharacterized Fe-S cluster-containing protein
VTWKPPGKDCGSCGLKTCDEFEMRVAEGRSRYIDCPFYQKEDVLFDQEMLVVKYSGVDILGQSYDFVILPIPGETSTRKYILPFRPDITEKFEIKKGDIVAGRPTGAGCPVQHVLRVTSADYITGVIIGHVVGPEYARRGDVKDVREYHMLGFEGLAMEVNGRPEVGKRHYFMPGLCMRRRAHTGVVSMIIEKPYGTHVKVEDIIIM